MTPLLVSFSDTGGGAARAAQRLLDALRSEGVGAELCVRERGSDDPAVRGLPPQHARLVRGLTTRATRVAAWLQVTPNPVLHSPNLLPTLWARHLRGDVVNLHWLGDGTMSVEDVARVDAPVVMTLHDMWAFCGAEHYAPDAPDARWVVGYTRHNRPAGHRRLDVDRLTWLRKRRSWAPMTVVAPSRWLADCARRSALMSGWPVHVVPNPLDLSVYRAVDRHQSRRALGVPLDVPVLLFAAIGGGEDPRKGFDLLVDALRDLGPAGGAVGLVAGQDTPDVPVDAGIPLYWAGRIDDDHRMASLYAAADVVVVPSRQENLPQTATEAQACGTPVVAFDTTGLPDVVVHGETGYLAAPFDITDLAEGIRWVLEDKGRRTRLGEAARRRAERLWAPDVVARQYVEVYEQAIAAHKR